jgi:hypothetical protein
MKVLEIKTVNGPNFWSNYRHQLAVLKTDLGEMEQFPTNQIPGFTERIKLYMPSLHSHRCSEDYEGGFFVRVQDGTWMGHVIEQIALEIQTLAGMQCGFGRTRSTGDHAIYTVIFTYEIEEAGVYAASAAVSIAQKLISGEAFDLNEHITYLKRSHLRSGLGFDHCDISIVTNISEDHLGLKGIKTLAEMAQVKAVVPKSTFDKGYAILNADDDLVFEMSESLYLNIALFSMDANNARVKKHCENGGLAAVIEKGYLTICKGSWKRRVARVESIPLTIGGKADCMIKNILPSALAAIFQNFKIDDRRRALQTFIPSPEHTPGRMNIFKFRNFELMVDYAHNTGGFEELCAFMKQVDAPHKVVIITGVGDRRDEDIRNLGSLSGQMFGEIIIRHDKDMRGGLKVKSLHCCWTGSG